MKNKGEKQIYKDRAQLLTDGYTFQTVLLSEIFGNKPEVNSFFREANLEHIQLPHEYYENKTALELYLKELPIVSRKGNSQKFYVLFGEQYIRQLIACETKIDEIPCILLNRCITSDAKALAFMSYFHHFKTWCRKPEQIRVFYKNLRKLNNILHLYTAKELIDCCIKTFQCDRRTITRKPEGEAP